MMTHYRKHHATQLPAYGVLPSLAYIRAVLDYDPSTGFLSWAKRPPELCSPVVDARGNAWSSREISDWFNMKFAGKRAGSKAAKWNSATGSMKYPSVKLNGVNVPASHLCWLLVKGRWPQGRIKALDGNPTNLVFDNLQETKTKFHPVWNRGALARQEADHDT